jgi:hypothetical protein
VSARVDKRFLSQPCARPSCDGTWLLGDTIPLCRDCLSRVPEGELKEHAKCSMADQRLMVFRWCREYCRPGVVPQLCPVCEEDMCEVDFKMCRGCIALQQKVKKFKDRQP